MRHKREAVIRRATDEYRRLDRLVAKLTDEQWALPVPRPEDRDAWTVKDALPHITHWKLNVVRTIRKEKRPAEERGLKMQQTNRYAYLKWRDVQAAEVLAWHRRVQRELLRALKEVPDAYYAKEHNENWPFDVDGHSAYHRQRDIEAALKGRRS